MSEESPRATSDPLATCPPLSRGLLLAARWAGRPPVSRLDPLLEQRWKLVEGLRPEAMDSLKRRWLEQEAPRRIDDALDLHWSWLEPELRDWPPLELVWFLLHVPARATAQELLRTFYPKIQPHLNRPLGEHEPPASLVAAVRRAFYARFLLRLETPQPEGTREAASPRVFLTLDRAMLHLLVQEAGLHVIALAGGPAPPRDLASRVAALESSEATRLQRLYKKGLPAPVGATGDAADPELAAAYEAGRTEAAEDLDLALAAAGPEGDVIAFAGLRFLARALAGESSVLCRHLAQRMNAPAAGRFLEWREQLGATGGLTTERREATRRELARRLGVVLSRGATRTAAGRLEA